jgi:4-hydroxybenzoyl-CoA thioesterase
MAFLHRIPVRFDDVDFARIVYFPRLFGYAHQTFEAFFAEEVGVPYARMLQDRKVGYPTVHAEADFKQPLRFGDICRVSQETVKVGNRSITSRYQLFRDESDVLCAELQVVTVTIGMDDFGPQELPEDVRQAFLRHKAR